MPETSIVEAGRRPVETIALVLGKSPLTVMLAGAAFISLFLPTLSELVRYWVEEPDFSHGFLIPIICAFLIVPRIREIGSLEARRSLMGLGLLLTGLVLFFFGRFTFTVVLQRLGMFGAFLGSIWFILGPSVLRKHPFPFFYLLLCIPPPYFLINPLRMTLKAWATRLSSDVLTLFGTPALARGNVLVMAEHTLEVADACTGIRSLMAITSAAILIAYLHRTGIAKGAFLMLAVLPIVIMVNCLRIIVMAVALAGFGTDLTRGIVHDAIGIAAFAISIALLYLWLKFSDWFFSSKLWRADP